MTKISLLTLIPLGISGLGKQDDRILTPPSTEEIFFLQEPHIGHHCGSFALIVLHAHCPELTFPRGMGYVDWVSVSHFLPLELWMRVGLASWRPDWPE